MSRFVVNCAPILKPASAVFSITSVLEAHQTSQLCVKFWLSSITLACSNTSCNIQSSCETTFCSSSRPVTQCPHVSNRERARVPGPGCAAIHSVVKRFWPAIEHQPARCERCSLELCYRTSRCSDVQPLCSCKHVGNLSCEHLPDRRLFPWPPISQV